MARRLVFQRTVIEQDRLRLPELVLFNSLSNQFIYSGINKKNIYLNLKLFGCNVRSLF
jgi:hypothetical protein